ncbi:trichohyalin-like [Lytechinus pictus]|uniref:trichohyalin-like n=1 Tax=Lytechinus pictus TaxID=7653 RepID=UPI0030B9B9C8
MAPTGRGSLWEDVETLCLLNIWREKNIQEQMDGTVRNKTVFRKICQLMKERGFERAEDQIKRKIKQLRASFRKTEDNNNRSGRGRITCKFYSELQEIFGGRPETAPVAILASQPEEEDQSESLDSVDSDSLPREEEEDGAEEDRSITDDELEENDVEAPTELVGNFPPEDLEGPSTSSANGRKATGEKRKKSKLQESFGLIAKEIKTLEEDSTNAFNAREDRFMQRQMEWERELLMKAQRTEEKKLEEKERRRREEREHREQEKERDRQHQLQMLQALMAGMRQSSTSMWQQQGNNSQSGPERSPNSWPYNHDYTPL